MLEGLSKRQIRKVCNMDAVASVDNLFLAANKARRNKRRRPDVEDWWLRRESEINALREELISGAYQPGPYRFFEVRQPKRRMIAAAPFRDRVVHHALCNYLQPVLERHFIARSFSCQKGKGTTAARECCRLLTNRYRYVLKCDVRKFFPNLDHGVIQKRMETYIADPRMLELVAIILSSYRTGSELAPPLFPDDDWVLACQRPRGLPIGNLTSQLWGNDYLDAMDHVITEMHGHGAYVRYTDDFLLFDNDNNGFRVVLSESAPKAGKE